MIDILSYWQRGRKTKISPSGWVSGNAVCCSHNGHSTDRRQRGGIKQFDGGWSYSCFNCGFTASFRLGRTVSFKVRRLLDWLGVPQSEIEALAIETLRHRSVHGIIDSRIRSAADTHIDFDESDDLPPKCELVTPDLKQHWQYLRQRCVPDDFPAMTSTHSDGNWTRPFVLIPFTFENKLVGWTARFLDDRTPKYISHSQPGYVFGIDQQHDSWQYVLVTEGIFDALSINGVAVMHNDISDSQVRLINSLGKKVIVVPDQDPAGLNLIDRAIDLGWAVSVPEWQNCKDVNDAVKKYGLLATLLTIMASCETGRIKIEMRKRQVAKRFFS